MKLILGLIFLLFFLTGCSSDEIKNYQGIHINTDNQKIEVTYQLENDDIISAEINILDLTSNKNIELDSEVNDDIIRLENYIIENDQFPELDASGNSSELNTSTNVEDVFQAFNNAIEIK